MKILNDSIKIYLISGILFSILCIVFAVLITVKIYENNIHNVYIDNGLTIDINPLINKEINKLKDLDGLKTKQNNINITNNNNIRKKYQIVLTPLINEDENIRICFDNKIIRSLNKFDKKDNNYIIYEDIIDSEHTKIHSIKLWIDSNSNLDKLKVRFNIKIFVFDE